LELQDLGLLRRIINSCRSGPWEGGGKPDETGNEGGNQGWWNGGEEVQGVLLKLINSSKHAGRDFQLMAHLKREKARWVGEQSCEDRSELYGSGRIESPIVWRGPSRFKAFSFYVRQGKGKGRGRKRTRSANREKKPVDKGVPPVGWTRREKKERSGTVSSHLQDFKGKLQYFSLFTEQEKEISGKKDGGKGGVGTTRRSNLGGR